MASLDVAFIETLEARKHHLGVRAFNISMLQQGSFSLHDSITASGSYKSFLTSLRLNQFSAFRGKKLSTYNLLRTRQNNVKKFIMKILAHSRTFYLIY